MTSEGQLAQEKLPLLMFILCIFLLGIPRVFTLTASQTLFLEKFGAQSLPYVYLCVAVAVPAVGFLFLKLETRLPMSSLLLASLIPLIVSPVILRLSLLWTDASWPVFLIAIWSELENALTSVVFWGLANSLFDVRQGRKFFGRISSGGVIAFIIGGFSIPPLVSLMGPANLLLVSAFGSAVSLGLIFYIISSPQTFHLLASNEEVFQKRQEPSWYGMRNKYIMFILGMSALSVAGYYFVDNAFYERAAAQYPDNETLASFFGVFFAISGFIILIMKLFISGRIMNHFGLSAGLLLLPIMVLCGAAAVAVTGTFFGAIPIIFWLMSATKLFDEVLRESMNNTAVLILYQPLPTQHRLHTQTAVESMVKPIAGGITGAILLYMNMWLDFRAIELVYGLLVVLGLWIAISFILRGEYTKALQEALVKRRMGDASIVTDGSSINILKKALDSPHPAEVNYALDVLEKIHPKDIGTWLIQLLDHPEKRIQKDVVYRIGRLGITDATEIFRRRLSEETSSEMKCAILRNLPLLDDEVTDLVSPYLEDHDSLVRMGAMIGLLQSGGIEGIIIAGAKLMALIESEDHRDRHFACVALGETRMISFYKPLVKLLNDKDLGIKRVALEAAGKIKNPKLWPVVIEYLNDPSLRSTAAKTLVSGGDNALPALEAAFSREGQPNSLLKRIVRVCGRIGGVKAVGFLRNNIDFPREDVRHRIFVALQVCGYHAPKKDIPIIHQMIRNEVADAAWAIAAAIDVNKHGKMALLEDSLTDELTCNRERIFMLLSFIYSPDGIHQAWVNLNSNSSSRKAFALEFIDNLLPRTLKGIIFPLIENMTSQQRLNALNTEFHQPVLGWENRLKEIVCRQDMWTVSWTKSCALYLIGKNKIKSLEEATIHALSSVEPLIRETAVWSLGQLAPDNLEEQLQPTLADHSPQVVEMARYFAGSSSS